MAVALRLARPADAPDVAAIYAPFVTDAVVSFETTPPTADEMARRIEATLRTLPWLVADDGGRVVGYAYATPYRSRAAYQWTCEVSVYLAATHRRQGVGRRLYGALFAVLRAQGFVTAHAGIALPNAASVGLHEALGFAPVGVYRGVGFKAGAWRDVGWWALRLREDPDPQPVRPLSADLVRDALAAPPSA